MHMETLWPSQMTRTPQSLDDEQDEVAAVQGRERQEVDHSEIDVDDGRKLEQP